MSSITALRSTRPVYRAEDSRLPDPTYYTTGMDTDTIITLPKGVLESARMSADEAKQELALSLYAQGRLSVGKARELAGMSLWTFRQLLALRGLPPHYDLPDLEEDLATLRALGRP